eukprot:SAG11_NODE_2262_length_3608_cov_3.051012_1_plen_144_part_00
MTFRWKTLVLPHLKVTAAKRSSTFQYIFWGPGPQKTVRPDKRVSDYVERAPKAPCAGHSQHPYKARSLARKPVTMTQVGIADLPAPSYPRLKRHAVVQGSRVGRQRNVRGEPEPDMPNTEEPEPEPELDSEDVIDDRDSEEEP